MNLGKINVTWNVGIFGRLENVVDYWPSSTSQAEGER
jgi:hypothetical protein